MHVRALLVDYDPVYSARLRVSLATDNVRTTCVSSSAEAFRMMKSADVVLVGELPPDTDPLWLCRRLRQEGHPPIVIVSNGGASRDVIDSLGAGVDDYVTRPVPACELAARIRAVLRRSEHEPGAPGRLRLGNLDIHPAKGAVFRHGVQVHLTPTEFRLLVELTTEAPDMVTRADLISRVWGHHYTDDSRLLDVHICRLRLKVETDPNHPALLRTVRGPGYRAAVG